MTHPAAQEPGVGVAGIDEWLDAERRAIRRRGITPDAKDRPRETALAFSHRRQPRRGRTREQSHEDGLRLVVGGVTERDHRRADPRRLRPERRVPGVARVILERAAWRNRDADRAKGQTTSLSECRHDVGFARRSIAEAVVDVSDAEPPTAGRSQPGERVEHRREVRPSAAGDKDRLSGRDDAATIGGDRDCTPDACDGGHALTWRQGPWSSGRGGGSWIRTRDIPGMNRLLYHLS